LKSCCTEAVLNWSITKLIYPATYSAIYVHITQPMISLVTNFTQKIVCLVAFLVCMWLALGMAKLSGGVCMYVPKHLPGSFCEIIWNLWFLSTAMFKDARSALTITILNLCMHLFMWSTFEGLVEKGNTMCHWKVLK